jgi:uncharacterized membrane protein YgcG
LTDGNEIVSALRSRGQILIWTDTSLHGQQYLGPPYTFGFQQLGANCGIIAPHASADVNGVAYWMSKDAFFVFDGTVQKIPCTEQDYVFEDMNIAPGTKGRLRASTAVPKTAGSNDRGGNSRGGSSSGRGSDRGGSGRSGSGEKKASTEQPRTPRANSDRQRTRTRRSSDS